MHMLIFVCSTNQILNFKFLICCVVVAVSVTSAKALKLQFNVGSADFSDWRVTLGNNIVRQGGWGLEGWCRGLLCMLCLNIITLLTRMVDR